MPASSRKPTNVPLPTPARLASTSSTLASPSTSPTTSSRHNVRPPAQKLVPSEALGRYLSSMDRRDRSFMAILAAFATVSNQALCVKELVDVVRDKQLLVLGGATPSGTINSAIRNHINRCAEQQLPCLLSRHVLSGDASDARLAPAIGVKAHHRSRAPPIASAVDGSGLTEDAPSSLSASHAAAVALLGTEAANILGTLSQSPSSSIPLQHHLSHLERSGSISSFTSSTIDPSASFNIGSTASTRPSSPRLTEPSPSQQKVYMKNKNGKTRKGVCCWYLSPWTGFENPFVREGFTNLQFQTDGPEIPAGETRLSPEDFTFHWAPVGKGDRERGEGGHGMGMGSAPSTVPPTPMDDERMSFFAPTTTAASSSSKKARASSSSVRPRKNKKAAAVSAATPVVALTAVVDAAVDGSLNADAESAFLAPLPQLAPSGTPDENDVKLDDDLMQLPAPLPPSPSMTAPSTVDPISDVDMMMDAYDSSEQSSSSSSSSTSDEDSSDAESEAMAPGHFDEDERMDVSSELAPEDAENFEHYALSWGGDDEDADDDASDEDHDDDEDSAEIITPRSSIVSVGAAVHSHSDESESWPASVAMGMELSVGLNTTSAAAVSSSPSKRPVHRRGDSSSHKLFLNIPPNPHHHHHHHVSARHSEEQDHDSLTSPFTPLSDMSAAHAHDSPSPDGADEFSMEDLGLGGPLDSDMDLAVQNGDARRAAEEDILDLDELLDGGANGLHEIEEAWGDDEKDSVTATPARKYPSPEPSGSEAGFAQRRTRSHSYSVVRPNARASSPVPVSSSYHQPRPTTTRHRRQQSTQHPVRQHARRRSSAAAMPTTGLTSPVSIASSLPSIAQASPALEAPVSTPSPPASGTPGRMYCPGMCVPMPRPQSRGPTPSTPTAESIPRIVVSSQLPSTPPRTPSPSPLSRSRPTDILDLGMGMDMDFGFGSMHLQTPQAELDALLVPGAAVSESPTPAALLLPSEEDAQVGAHETPVGIQFAFDVDGRPTSASVSPLPLPLGHSQLSRIVIPTLVPSNPPLCATFVDGILVYTLTDPASGKQLMRAVDSDYVHLSSLIDISQPPLSSADAVRIISMCHSPHIINPSFSSSSGTITALAGSWVSLEDARQLCAAGELNIVVEVGKLFLEPNLGEQYFPDPLPEWCRSRKQLRNAGLGMGLGFGMPVNGLGVGNTNVSAMAALAELARMGGVPSMHQSPVPAPISAHVLEMPQLGMLQAMTQQQVHPHPFSLMSPMHDARAPSPSGLSSFSSLSIPTTVSSASLGAPPSLTRTVSTASLSSISSSLTSPPVSPPPMSTVSGDKIAHASTPSPPSRSAASSTATLMSDGIEPPKKRGPGRPRKIPGAPPPPPTEKKRRRAIAATAPISSRQGRAAARSLRGSTSTDSLPR